MNFALAGIHDAEMALGVHDLSRESYSSQVYWMLWRLGRRGRELHRSRFDFQHPFSASGDERTAKADLLSIVPPHKVSDAEFAWTHEEVPGVSTE
jgi:hypothetical protein